MNNTKLKLVSVKDEHHHTIEAPDRIVDQTSTAPERWVPAEVIAEHLGFTRRRILDMVRKREIPGEPFGKGKRHDWRFKLSEVDAAIRTRTRASRSTMSAGSPRRHTEKTA